MGDNSLYKKQEWEKAWKCVLIEQSEMAIKLLKSRKNLNQSIHESRKAFKKCRAILRTVKHAFDEYEAQNIFFRDMGRQLSELRDYQVVQETLINLYKDKNHPASRSSCRTISKSLSRRKSILEKVQIKQEKTFEHLVMMLQTKVKEMNDWKIKSPAFELMAKSIKQTYKKGQELLKIAKETGMGEDYHKWRKQAQNFRYQLEFIQPIWPNYFEALENEFHKLTDMIGAAQDLVVLEKLMANEDIKLRKIKLDALKESIDYHKQANRQNALELGARCYVFKPNAIKKLLYKLA